MVEQIGEFREFLEPQGRTTGCNNHEGILRYVGPGRGKSAHMSQRIEKKDTFLPPRVPELDYLELLIMERMKRMSYPKELLLTSFTLCS